MIEEFEYVGTRVFIDLNKVEGVGEMGGVLMIRMVSGFSILIDQTSLDDFVKRWKIAKAKP